MLALRCAYCGKPVSVEALQPDAPEIVNPSGGKAPVMLCTICTVLWYTADSGERRMMKHAIFFKRNAADLFSLHAPARPAGAA